MPRLRTSLAQFALVGGRRRNHTEAVACREPSRRPFGPSGAHLYLLAEHAAARGHDHRLCHVVMREVQSAFAAEEATLGTAAALDRALRLVNQVMWEETRTAPPHKRLPIGLLAVALDGADAYLCQIATGQALLGRGGDLIGLPELGHWQALHTGEVAPAVALGQAPDLDLAIVHCRLAPGDLLLLCSTNLARLLDGPTLADLPHQPIEAVATRLCGVAEQYGLPHTSGMGIQIIETPLAEPAPLAWQPVALPPVAAAAAARQGLFGRLRTGLRPARSGEPAAPPMAAEPAPGAAPTATIATGDLPDNVFVLYKRPPLAPAEALDDRPTDEPADDAVAATPGAGAAAIGGAASRLAARSPRRARAAPPRWMEALAAAAVIGQAGLRQVPRALARRPASTRPARRRPGGSAPSRPAMAEPVYRGEGGLATATADGSVGAALARSLTLPWPISPTMLVLVLAAIGAALIAAAGATSLAQGGGLALLGRGPEPAGSLAARPVAREVVEPVLEPILVGPMPTEIEPATLPAPLAAGQASAAPVTDQLTLDAANRVSRLGPVTVLADLGSGTPATAPKQLIVGPSGIYVLDPYAGILYLIDGTGKAPTPLLSRGWTIAREKVTDLTGATWRGDTLVVVDRQRAYTLDGPNGTWRAAPLAATNLGLGVHPLATFEGSLYVLDQASRQVLKFAQGAYGRAPQPWLRPTDKVDLSGAVDITIDGRIYVLTASGQILHLFRGGLERTVTVDVTPPVQAPTALISPASGGVFYLAESGGRILKLSRDGLLLRQFRLPEGSPELTGLSDLWVDEAGRAFYAVVGNRVVRIAFPAPTSPRHGRSLAI